MRFECRYATINPIKLTDDLFSPRRIRQLMGYTGSPTITLLLCSTPIFNNRWLNSVTLRLLHMRFGTAPSIGLARRELLRGRWITSIPRPPVISGFNTIS